MKCFSILFLVFNANIVLSQMYEKCVYLKNNTIGDCKKFKDCASAIENLRKNIIPQSCGFDKNDPLVCCPTELACCTDCDCQKSVSNGRSIQKCLEYSKEVSSLPRVPIDPDGIIDGRDAGVGDYPHMAALGFGKSDIKWQCGGSLISPRFVLTAAHCRRHQDYGEVSFVRLGDIFLNGSSNTHQDYQVKRTIVHPDYKAPIVYHDIALVELNQSIVFNTYIKPACLNTIPVLNFTWDPQILGWGLTKFGGSTINTLQVTEVEFFTADECTNLYKTHSRKYPRGILSDMQTCAGGRKSEKDTCQGDSGGPLQIFDYKHLMFSIIGITSFGKSCGVQNVPGVYVKVSHYVSWIENIVWP